MRGDSDSPASQDMVEDEDSSARLFETLYRDLRALAGRMLQRESPGHTLPPTALVHEAFIRLNGREREEWKSRSHFFAAGASAMRRILVDHARKRRSQKRGGERERTPLTEDVLLVERDSDVLVVNDALDDLAQLNERHAKILEFRFFGGLTEAEIAEALGVSERTVQREWFVCRAWLRTYLEGESPS